MAGLVPGTARTEPVETLGISEMLDWPGLRCLKEERDNAGKGRTSRLLGGEGGSRSEECS